MVSLHPLPVLVPDTNSYLVYLELEADGSPSRRDSEVNRSEEEASA